MKRQPRCLHGFTLTRCLLGCAGDAAPREPRPFHAHGGNGDWQRLKQREAEPRDVAAPVYGLRLCRRCSSFHSPLVATCPFTGESVE